MDSASSICLMLLSTFLWSKRVLLAFQIMDSGACCLIGLVIFC